MDIIMAIAYIYQATLLTTISNRQQMKSEFLYNLLTLHI